MSERAPQNDDDLPIILDLAPHPDNPRAVTFTISHDTRGKDILATMRYMYPDAQVFHSGIVRMLKWGIENKGFLNNGTIEVGDPTGKVSEQLSFERAIRLGDKPTYDEIQLALRHVYGEDGAVQREQTLLCELVDEGKYIGASVVGRQHDEITTAQADDIAREMEELMRRYGS